jgi:F420-dependent oxidoreductase-like protein
MLLRIFTEPQQGAGYDDLLAVARIAEEEGFDGFFRSDHFLRMGSGSGEPGPTDAWITLAGLARETTRLRLGTLVSSATFRLPGPLAVTVAQVDAMSGGRVELGLGAGWFEAEHMAYGIPFSMLGERFQRLEEQLAVITGLWRTAPGQRFSFDGRYYQLADSPALPKPVQQPAPPVIVGGGGARRTPVLAARFADEFNMPPGHGFAGVAPQYERVRAACEAEGRDPSTLILSAAVTVCCGSTPAEIATRAASIGRSVEDLRSNGLCGTPSELVDRLGNYAEAGAERVYLQVLDLADLEHLRLLGAEVLPFVR